MRLTNPYDPWAHIGTVWPHIHVETARTLPDGVAGLIGDGVIWLCRSLSQRARRDPSQTKAIREWARGEGIALADRGRIPADIEARYHAAMKR